MVSLSMSDKELEVKIRSASFSDSTHKKMLKKRLFQASSELSLGDLTGVTGGVADIIGHPDNEQWNPWPNSPTNPNRGEH